MNGLPIGRTAIDGRFRKACASAARHSGAAITVLIRRDYQTRRGAA
jgi:hypothetical protein